METEEETHNEMHWSRDMEASQEVRPELDLNETPGETTLVLHSHTGPRPTMHELMQSELPYQQMIFNVPSHKLPDNHTPDPTLTMPRLTHRTNPRSHNPI